MTQSATEKGTDVPEAATVVAAGGVVIDRAGADARVLVVHRPTYDDWSLPKGHLDAGERPVEAATREVLEETGVVAALLQDAGSTEHTITEHAIELEGRTAIKRVHWFVMTPAGGIGPESRAPDTEIDLAEWWPVTRALVDLTYANERELLARIVATS